MSQVDTTVLMQNALHEIKRLRSKLENFEEKSSMPIAIIGMSCRFAGVTSANTLWERLLSGFDGVGNIPPDRWNTERYFDSNLDSVGGIYCRTGSFLNDITSFDAGFFGISAREAAMMDPQQRLLLEVVWEALENAGIPADELKGSRTAVFAGLMHQDYSHRFRKPEDVDLYTASGNSPSVLAGRVSHVLGLHGPTLTIDTACSSSLVAVHLACNSLRAGECDIAVVGGVNIVLSPLSTAAECRAHMLSPSGKCRSFDNAADGFVRGDGCGVVILQRLPEAEKLNRNIDAYIAGSAVNHDGRSAGLTVPNEHAQRELLQTALQVANMEASQINYIEAHGTGTSLGDPIEVAALASVFSSRTLDKQVLLGSIKSNLGHLEGAAGIAGLIKAVLVARHRLAPPTIHVKTPNLNIEWEKLPLRLALSNEQIGTRDFPCVVGVSSFGFSGTNAHAILVSPSKKEDKQKTIKLRPQAPQIMVISAKSDTSLRDNAARYANYLAGVEIPNWPSVCNASITTRSHFSHRLAIVSKDLETMTEELRLFASNKKTEVISGVCSSAIISRKTSITLPTQGNDDTETDRIAFLKELAKSYIDGAFIKPSVDQSDSHKPIRLPFYAFNRKKHWVEEPNTETLSPLYYINWQVAKPPEDTSYRSGKRLIIGSTKVCASIAQSLESRGEQCTVIGNDINAILNSEVHERGIVFVLDNTFPENNQVETIAYYGSLFKSLASYFSKNSSSGPIVFITFNAVSTAPAEDVDPVSAAISAAIRVVRREQGEKWAGTIDIEKKDPSLTTLTSLLGKSLYEDQIAVRGKTVLVPRLLRAGSGTTDALHPLDKDSTYLLTGGTGALGIATAHWLISRGARHLILVNRSGESNKNIKDSCEKLRKRGAEVRIIALDIATESLKNDSILPKDRPIRGIVHCAGIIQDGPIETMEDTVFKNVLEAKIKGMLWLEEIARKQPIDFFLLYSSISAVVSQHGQSAYAAANAYLDAFAQHLTLLGRPVLSIGWGLWASGMGATDAKIASRINASGLRPLKEVEAFSALERAFVGRPHILIASIDHKKIASQPDLPHLVKGLVGQSSTGHRKSLSIEQVRNRTAKERRVLITNYIETELSRILSSSSKIPHDVSLLDLGIDSLTGSEFRNALERSLGVSIDLSKLVDGSSLDILIARILLQVEQILITENKHSPDTNVKETIL